MRKAIKGDIVYNPTTKKKYSVITSEDKERIDGYCHDWGRNIIWGLSENSECYHFGLAKDLDDLEKLGYKYIPRGKASKVLFEDK